MTAAQRFFASCGNAPKTPDYYLEDDPEFADLGPSPRKIGAPAVAPGRHSSQSSQAIVTLHDMTACKSFSPEDRSVPNIHFLCVF